MLKSGPQKWVFSASSKSATRHVLERADLDDARVVDENVDHAMLGDHALDGSVDLGVVPDVATNDRWRDATTSEIGLARVQLLLVACGESDACAFGDELAGDHQPVRANRQR